MEVDDRRKSDGDEVGRLVAELGTLPSNPRAHWARVRDAFAREVAVTPDADIAGTFFNSVTRRLLGTIGSDPGAEFGPPLGQLLRRGPVLAQAVEHGSALLFQDPPRVSNLSHQ